VLQANPQDISAQVARADILARSGDYPASIPAYQTVLQNDPQNRRARLGLAEAYSYSRQYNNAIDVYNELILAEPNNVAYRIARGRTLGYAQHYSDAVSALQPVVQENPANTEARLALAEVQSNSGNRALRSSAVAHYQTILGEEPSNTQARLGLGRVYSYQGNYGPARAQFHELLRAQPNNEEALLGLADTERFAGQPFEARRLYRRVLDGNSDSERAQQGLTGLRRETSPSLTAAYRNYSDTNDVRIRSFLAGPTLRFPAGTIGITGETGTYEDDGVEFRRRAVNLLLARNFGGLQARLLLNRITYGGAPSRTLYDVLLQKSPDPRRRYYVSVGRRELSSRWVQCKTASWRVRFGLASRNRWRCALTWKAKSRA
jgi:tetratricopeptide (TPR) repeat protein